MALLDIKAKIVQPRISRSPNHLTHIIIVHRREALYHEDRRTGVVTYVFRSGTTGARGVRRDGRQGSSRAGA